MPGSGCSSCQLTHVTTCAIYTRISEDKLADGHGVTNQLNDLARLAEARGWTVTDRLSDNDIGVTRKDPRLRLRTGPAMRRGSGSSTRTRWTWCSAGGGIATS